MCTREADAPLLKTLHDAQAAPPECLDLLERAIALGSGEILEPIDFPSQISERVNRPPISTSSSLRRVGRVLPIAEVERHAILNAVAEAKGDKLLAARMLGIGKTTLYRKLREYESSANQSELAQNSPAPTA